MKNPLDPVPGRVFETTASGRIRLNRIAKLICLCVACHIAGLSSWGFTLYNSNLHPLPPDPLAPAPPQADYDNPPGATDFTDCINNPSDHWAWPTNTGQVVINYYFDPSFDSLFTGPDAAAAEAGVKAQIVQAMQQWELAYQNQDGWYYYGYYDSYSRLDPLSLDVVSPQTIQKYMDVRSATLHELGHVLGFAHCDQGATANPVRNYAYFDSGVRGYGEAFGTLATYTLNTAPANFYLANPAYYQAGLAGLEVMSEYSVASASVSSPLYRQPGEVYHILSWDELDGYGFIYGGFPLQFNEVSDSGSANLVIQASFNDPRFVSQFPPGQNVPFDPSVVCEGIPFGTANGAGGITINRASITFNLGSMYDIGYETAGFNFDITTSPSVPATASVTLQIAGTDNTTLAAPTFDNFTWYQGNPAYQFNPGVVSYLGNLAAGGVPLPNDSTKDSISVKWSLPGSGTIPSGTLIHVGIEPDVWDWINYPQFLTATVANQLGNQTEQVPASPVHIYGSAQYYGAVADASAPGPRITGACLTTASSTNIVGVRGLGIASSMDSTTLSSLQIADVTGMGLSLSNLNRTTLAELQTNNLLVSVTNFGTRTLNSNQEFVVILAGSANYLPGDIVSNGDYIYMLSESNLLDREIFAAVVSSNANAVVHNYSLLNEPTTRAVPLPRLTSPNSINSSSFQFSVANITPGVAFTVLSTSDLSVPIADWAVVGVATNPSPGPYQFTDTQATNAARYYIVRTQGQAPNCVAPPANLAYWWRGEDNALDSIGSNNGTLQGGVGYTSGEVGQAFSFDGSTGFVSTSTLIDNPQTFSLCLWFKTTSTSGGGLISFDSTPSQTTPGSSYDRNIYMDDAGALHFGFWNGAAQQVNSASGYNDGKWHLATGTLSASAGLAFYLDGVLVGTNSATGAQNYNGYWRFGQANLNNWPNLPSSEYFQGELDEVAVFNTVLTSGQAAAIYTAGSAGMCPP